VVALNEILESLYAEISENIRAIIPRRKIDSRARFVEFVASDDNQDITRYSASTRQFQIMPPVHTGDRQEGQSTTHPEFTIYIVFAYPTQTKWIASALDDLDQISKYFNTHPSSVSGVSARFIKAGIVMDSRRADEDQREYITLTLFAQLEVTH
jgi:DNA-binding MarR family transcriptional regulator